MKNELNVLLKCIKFICISNNIIYRIQKLYSATREWFLDGRILQRMLQKWDKNIDSYLLCMHTRRTSSLHRKSQGRHPNDNPRIFYPSALHKSSLLLLCSQHSLDMDEGEQFYRSRNHRIPLFAICWRTDEQSLQYLLQNANIFIAQSNKKKHLVSFSLSYYKIVSSKDPFNSSKVYFSCCKIF